METVVPGVYHSHVPSVTLPPYQTTECYWLGNTHEVVLVDTGDGSDAGTRVLEADWITLGRPRVVGVFATHYHHDHTGGGEWALNYWQAPLYLSLADQEILREESPALPWRPFGETHVDVGGQRIQIISAPGHTPGQWNFWLPEAKVLLAGDNVLGNSTVVITPPHGHLGDYLESLKNLIALDPQLIAPGHGDLVYHPEPYLQYYLDHRQERTQEILALLAQGDKSAREMAETIYGDQLPGERMAFGEWMVKGHLDWCMQQGMVGQSGERYQLIRGAI